MAKAEKSPNAPTSAKPADRKPPTIRNEDLPGCMETFADSITAVFFDGQSLRIEFGVTRLDDRAQNSDGNVSGRRYPACRLVLPPTAAIDLINKMQQVGAALIQAGMIKATPNPIDVGPSS